MCVLVPYILAGDSQHSNGIDNSQVTNIMTSQQAHKRHTAAYKSVKDGEEAPGAISASAANLEDFECPAGDRYKQHSSTLE